MNWLNLALACAALLLALALRPWRALDTAGPPWPWLAWWAGLPLLWGADRYAAMPIVQPLSGAALLVLLAGWPLAMPALGLTALITMAMGGLDAAEALQLGQGLGAGGHADGLQRTLAPGLVQVVAELQGGRRRGGGRGGNRGQRGGKHGHVGQHRGAIGDEPPKGDRQVATCYRRLSFGLKGGDAGICGGTLSPAAAGRGGRNRWPATAA